MKLLEGAEGPKRSPSRFGREGTGGGGKRGLTKRKSVLRPWLGKIIVSMREWRGGRVVRGWGIGK